MWWNLSVDFYLMLEKEKKKGFTLVSLIDHKTRFYFWILDTRKFKNKSRKDGHCHFWETIHVTSSSCNATRRKLISRPRVSLEGFRPTFTIFFSSLHLPLFLFILISLIFFLLCLIRSSRLHLTISRSHYHESLISSHLSECQKLKWSSENLNGNRSTPRSNNIEIWIKKKDQRVCIWLSTCILLIS